MNPISIRLDSATVEELDAEAEAADKSRNSYLKGIIGRRHEYRELYNNYKELESKWVEYGRDEWEGTPIHTSSAGGGEDSNARVTTVTQSDTDKTEVVRDVRQATGGGEEGAELLQQIEDEELGQESAREVVSRVNTARNAKNVSS